MVTNTWTDLFTYLQTLMTTNAGFFESIGNRLFAALAVIMVAWFGIQTALRGTGVDTGRLANLLMRLAIGLAMTRYYSTPLPGFGGRSFVHLIIDQGTFLANQLEASTVTRIMDRLNALYIGLESPGASAILNAIEVIRWAVTILAILAAQISLYFIVAFGYVAVAVCVLVGPIFIPFWLVPELKFLFDGWFRSTLQFAFYPVIAQAFLAVFGNLLINFVDRAGTELSGPALGAIFFPLLSMLIAFVWGMLKVPSLTNSIFSGRAGESATPERF